MSAMPPHVTDLAINRAMGMQLAPHGSDHIVTLPASPPGGAPGSGALLLNHVGSVHASVQFALAEAASGELLLQHLGAAQVSAGDSLWRDQVFAVLRTSSVKFRSLHPGGASCAPQRALRTPIRRRCQLSSPPGAGGAAARWSRCSSKSPTHKAW
ncbi:MAG: hypothetical protein L0Y44_03570 [Phycisphaerales bacterium]|nr:hypothetical protein [Phycisphaerales bacterium]